MMRKVIAGLTTTAVVSIAIPGGVGLADTTPPVMIPMQSSFRFAAMNQSTAPAHEQTIRITGTLQRGFEHEYAGCGDRSYRLSFQIFVDDQNVEKDVFNQDLTLNVKAGGDPYRLDNRAFDVSTKVFTKSITNGRIAVNVSEIDTPCGISNKPTHLVGPARLLNFYATLTP